jgi:hypothetical protein
VSTPEAELRELLAWGRGLEGFTETHAGDGLVLAHRYIDGLPGEDGRWVQGIGVVYDRCAVLLAMDLAWLLWFDDCFDLGDAPVDFDLLLGAIHGPARSREGRGFQHLRAQMEQASTAPSAIGAWTRTAIDVFHAYQFNAEWSRTAQSLSYGEYLDNGERSIATAHFVAATALVYGWDLSARLLNEDFRRCLRHLGLLTRLQNDLASAERERYDRTPANAVLLLEPTLGQAAAREFVQQDLDGYRRLLQRDLAGFSPKDPFRIFANILVSGTDRYYSDPRERYQVPESL